MHPFYEEIIRFIPLTLIFVNAFLVSRLLVVSEVAHKSVLWLLNRCGSRLSLLVFYLLLAAAVLSLFMPNVITILTLLPALRILNKKLQPVLREYSSTLLALAAIWGANIGGMGSMVGSPANALLMAYLEIYDIMGRQQINFLNWLVWGIPLVILFLVIAWGVLNFMMIPRRFLGAENPPIKINVSQWDPVQCHASFILIGFIIFWILESIFESLTPKQYGLWKAALSILYFGYFVFQTFIQKNCVHNKTMLTPRDCFNDLPLKGGALIVAAALLSILLVKIGIDKSAAYEIQSLMKSAAGPFLLVFVVTAAVKFLTEILSNTVVSIAFFGVAYVIADAMQYPPLIMMFAVSLSSTCAFMSPIATPVNSLAFAELKNVSLKTMVLLGFFMNLITSILLPAYLIFILPLFYT